MQTNLAEKVLLDRFAEMETSLIHSSGIVVAKKDVKQRLFHPESDPSYTTWLIGFQMTKDLQNSRN